MKVYGDKAASAMFSDDEKYRYALGRRWGGGPRIAVWVMLNPSTADHRKDDPTIRRCKAFAERLQCGAMIVVNLFAWRARDPNELLTVEDPVGPENDKVLAAMVSQTNVRVICGWGGHKAVPEGAAARIVGWARTPPVCLGHTKSGQPKHPLYVASEQDFMPVLT